MIIRDSLVYLAGRYGAAILTMLSVAVFTRLVAPAEYGRYALAVSSSFVLYCVTLQWLRLAIGRYLPGAGEKSDALLSQMLLSGALILLLVLALSVLAPLFLSGEDLALAFAAVMLFLAFGSAEVLVGVFQAWLNPKMFSILGLIRAACALLIGATLVLAGAGALGLIYGAALGHLAGTLLALKRILPNVELRRFDWSLTLMLARFGFLLAVGASLGAGMVFSDRYIVASLIGVEAAGAYSAASDLASRSLLIVISAISLAGAPRIFRAYDAGGLEGARPMLERQGQILLIVSLPATLLLILFTPAVVATMLGAKFQAGAISVMPWIVAGSLFQGARIAYFEYAFSLTKQLWHQAGVLLVAMLVGVGLNYVLIRSHGLEGAAVAYFCSNLFALAGAILFGRRDLALPLPTRDFFMTLLACAVMGAICWPFRETLSIIVVIAASSVAGIAFCIVLYGTNVSAFRAGVQSVLRRLPLPGAGKAAHPIP